MRLPSTNSPIIFSGPKLVSIPALVLKTERWVVRPEEVDRLVVAVRKGGVHVRPQER